MYAKVKGKCVFIGEERKVQVQGKPARVVKEFGFLSESPKGMPEVIKVVSWNGFAPKLNEVSEFECRVSTRVWQGKADLTVEVL